MVKFIVYLNRHVFVMCRLITFSVLHHKADHSFVSFEIIEPLSGYFENRISLEVGTRGAYAASQTTMLHMTRFNKPSLRFSFFCVFFVCKMQRFTFLYYYTSTEVNPVMYCKFLY